jgi:hypothetical protein
MGMFVFGSVFRFGVVVLMVMMMCRWASGGQSRQVSLLHSQTPNVPTKMRFSQIYHQKPNAIQNFQKINPNVEF